MSAQEAARDPTDLRQALAWLARQRELDGDQVTALSRDVQRLTQLTRDQSVQIEALTEELRQQKLQIGRLPAIDEQTRLLQDQIVTVESGLTERVELADRQAQARAAEWERDRRSLIEHTQRMGDLQRLLEALNGRLQALTEETKRDRAAVPPLAQMVGDFDRRLLMLGSRIQQLEEIAKRGESQRAVGEQHAEAVRAEIARLDNSLRLIEVRWTRQLAECEQRVDLVRVQAEEQAKPVQQVARQIVRVQENCDSLAAQTAELQKRAEGQIATFQRLDGLIGSGREAAGRLEQALEVVRRKAEEQGAYLARLEEKTQAEVASVGDFGRSLEIQSARQAEMAAALAQLADRQRRMEEGLAAIGQQLRERGLEIDDGISGLETRLTSGERETAERTARLAQLEMEQRERRIRGLREEMDELGALLGKLGISIRTPGGSQ